jgi:transcriptional regulator with XRE-family HTH domain
LLGLEIKRFRLEAGLTQKELAKKAGVTQQCISKYESCNVSYDYRTAMKIFDALDIEYIVRKKGERSE